MDQILSLLSETIPKAQTLEQLARPLLSLLNQFTGMESTYLTTIDTEQGVQRVEFARNVGAMTIPEGLVVPWAGTLCKRALEENRLYTDNVAECWGDSDAAKALGIKTYLSAPIRSQDGRVLGTVCAASSAQVARSANVEPILALLSGLLGYALERELLVAQLQTANTELARLALTDPLTGLANRRGIMRDLVQLFAMAQRDSKYVLVGVIDLDGFKLINDRYGHQAGDQFLLGIATALQRSLRTCDMVGRIGGDEFIVIALGNTLQRPDSAQELRDAALLMQARLSKATVGQYDLGNGLPPYDYQGTSVGVVAVMPDGTTAEEAIRLADNEMYQVKQQRRQQRS
ncbi:MAG: diguanylate cyclase [Ectopseudomonas guguanensis]|uniref:sensor domain-containing diguanylate cyclase n=1 Tax=Ectopseudomonas guguanensis TaxID=1198456 RepID=UPI00391ADCF1